MQKLIAEEASLQNTIALLRSIPGIGKFSSAVILAEWGGIFPCFINPNNDLLILALNHPNDSLEPLPEQKINSPSADRRMHAPR